MSRRNARSVLHGHQLGVEWSNFVTIQDDWDDEADTQTYAPASAGNACDYIMGFQPIVDKLIHLGSHADTQKDQLYMPHPKTNLLEAISYLSDNGRLGIQGGHIFWHEEDQTFSAAVLGEVPVKISEAEARVLLRTNYHIHCGVTLPNL